MLTLLIKAVIFVFLLGFIPLVLGLPWTTLISSKYPSALAYSVGFFMELAFFHIIVFIMTCAFLPFRAIVVTYSIALILCCIGCMAFCRKQRLFSRINTMRTWKKPNWAEWILLAAFLVLFSIQVVRGFTYDITYMSDDDAGYIVMATDTLNADQFGVIDYSTGEYGFFDIKRISQTSLIFPAYLAKISGVSVTTITHTVQYVQLIILAYATYLYMAGELFEKRDNRLIFLLLLSVFYFYGYHSHYSLSFRLLGPNYQGKAIVAVSMTPLVLTVLMKKLTEPYRWELGLFLLLLSTAVVSLTLWGTGTFITIVIIPIVLSLFRKERDWKHLLYIPWACAIPLGFVGIYALYRFAV